MTTLLRRTYSLARWLILLEVGIWRSLFLWVTRRVPGQRRGVQSFSYAQQVTPILGGFIFVSAVEVPVVHLLLPWQTVRFIVLGIGIWGLLWMVGLLASMRVFRHLLDDTALHIRRGTNVAIRIPWDAVESVNGRRGSVRTNKPVQVEGSDDSAVAHVAVLKQTNVAVVLSRSIPVQLSDGAQQVTEVRFYVDDLRAFLAKASEHLVEPLPAATERLAL